MRIGHTLQHVRNNGGKVEVNDRSEKITQIASLLSNAGAAHFRYETDELGGQYDTEWPHWYAGYLFEHGLSELIDPAEALEQAAASLEQLLKEADQSHKANAPDKKWETYYAEYWLDRSK